MNGRQLSSHVPDPILDAAVYYEKEVDESGRLSYHGIPEGFVAHSWLLIVMHSGEADVQLLNTLKAVLEAAGMGTHETICDYIQFFLQLYVHLSLAVLRGGGGEKRIYHVQ